MRKLLILLAMALPLFAYANENNRAEEAPKTNAYVIIATKSINVSTITFPYVVSVSVPSETVVGISGPTVPNMPWQVSNGTLYITYNSPDEFELFAGNTYYIEVSTNPMKYYAIQLNAY